MLRERFALLLDLEDAPAPHRVRSRRRFGDEVGRVGEQVTEGGRDRDAGHRRASGDDQAVGRAVGRPAAADVQGGAPALFPAGQRRAFEQAGVSGDQLNRGQVVQQSHGEGIGREPRGRRVGQGLPEPAARRKPGQPGGARSGPASCPAARRPICRPPRPTEWCTALLPDYFRRHRAGVNEVEHVAPVA